MSNWIGGNAFLRIVTGIALLAVVFTLVWVEALKVGFTLFVALLAIVALYEFQAMAQRSASKVEQLGGAALVLAMMVAAHYGGLAVLNLTLLLAVFVAASLHLFVGTRTITGAATAVFAIVYCGWLPAHFVLLHNIHGYGTPGPGLVTFLILLIAVSDTAAYVVGKNFGRHKLAPSISPKKTWEGAVGGILGALAVSLAMIVWINGHTHSIHVFGMAAGSLGASLKLSLSVFWIALPGVMLSIAGQVGDLLESMLKRDAGVKDSGRFLPGHGGVLDRCDGFLFAGPLLYYFIECIPFYRIVIPGLPG